MSNQGKKNLLKQQYGKKCFLCMHTFKNNKDLQFHHIKPKCEGGESSVENGALLCEECHKKIHSHKFGSTEYTNITLCILSNKLKMEIKNKS